jgi:hypothetical protein
MLLNSADLASIHRYCSHHRPLLERSAAAGCFSCGATFAPSDIKEWIREDDGTAAGGADETAKCPHCGVDAVLPSAAPIMLDARMLAALRSYWFSGPH